MVYQTQDSKKERRGKRIFVRCRLQTQVAHRGAEKPHRQHGPENNARRLVDRLDPNAKEG
jgi:hypothetical protein